MLPPTQNHSPEQLFTAANLYEQVAVNLEHAGYPWLAQFGHIAAAEIDLLNDGIKRSWGGPFNGQEGRTRIMEAVLSTCALENVIETGTFRGTTTEFLASRVAGRVYSCERDLRYFMYARRRLEAQANVEIHLSDSRDFLEALLSKPHERETRTLFYLDAHWNADLPLVREIEIALENHSACIVAIDDFEIPFDAGYGFDNYGTERCLSLPLLAQFRAAVPNFYFPALPSSEETGARRGCILFARNEELDCQLAGVPGLRPVVAKDWELYEKP